MRLWHREIAESAINMKTIMNLLRRTRFVGVEVNENRDQKVAIGTISFLASMIGTLWIADWIFDHYWRYRENWAYPPNVLQRASLILTLGTCVTLLFCCASIAIGVSTMRMLTRWEDGRRILLYFVVTGALLIDVLVGIFFAFLSLYACDKGWFPNEPTDYGWEVNWETKEVVPKSQSGGN